MRKLSSTFPLNINLSIKLDQIDPRVNKNDFSRTLPGNDGFLRDDYESILGTEIHILPAGRNLSVDSIMGQPLLG